MATIRTYGYQCPTRVDGYITTKEISLTNQLDPCRNLHPPRTCLFDDKAKECVMRNPLHLHDMHVTTNNVYHGEKYTVDRYNQPQLPLAPGLTKVHCIKPDFYRKVGLGRFNLHPIHDQSETHAKHKPLRWNKDMYGSKTLFIPERHVWVPQYRDFVYPFNKHEAHSVIRASHPYLTTNEYFHRDFSRDELEHYDLLNKLQDVENDHRKRDVQIKYRVRPMVDPFEQKVTLPNYDAFREVPAGRFCKVEKKYFKRPPYNGCPPRVFDPVVHLGWLPLYTESYGPPHPNHCVNKEAWTHPLKPCYLQPTMSAAATMRTPHMYKTENEVYGSGRNVASFVKTGLKFPELCDQYTP